uniref:Uncharacterized protein HPS10 n=1 Tax=Hordeum bulbosum TaxID=4516 RepID=B5UB75_HORBU|nr:hypothetical protein [Hordeum bulbosum]
MKNSKLALLSAMLLLVISATAGRDVPPVPARDNFLPQHDILHHGQKNDFAEAKGYISLDPIFHPRPGPPCASKAAYASRDTKVGGLC